MVQGSSDSKAPSVSAAQLRVNRDLMQALRKKHPASRLRARYDLRADNWKDLDHGRAQKVIAEIASGHTKNFVPSSNLSSKLAIKFEEGQTIDTGRSETSAQILRQMTNSKSPTAPKLRKLKKKEDFRIAGFPRAISVQDLQGKV